MTKNLEKIYTVVAFTGIEAPQDVMNQFSITRIRI